MASKKYLVRDGFVVALALFKQDGSTYERRYEAGEEVTLDDDQAAAHLHKLEFATQKDRDAALAAEQSAKVSTAAAQSPAEMMAMMTEVFTRALQAAGGVAPQAPAVPA